MITINRKELHAALTKVKPCVISTIDYPMLKCVVIEANNNQMWFTTFNLKLAIKTKIEYEGHIDFKIVIDFDVISKLIAKIPDETLTLKIVDYKITITGALSNFDITGNDASDFPELISARQDLTCRANLSWLDLKPKLNNIIDLVSDDITKKALTSVFFNGEVSPPQIAGGTPYIFAVYNLKEDTEFIDTKLLVSKDLVLASIAAFNEAIITLEAYGNIIRLKSENTEVIGFTILANMPAYGVFTQVDVLYDIPCNKKEIQTNLEVLNALKDDTLNHYLEIGYLENHLIFSNEAQGVGTGVVKMPCEGAYPELDIMFNFDTLINSIKHMGKDFIIKYVGRDRHTLLVDEQLILCVSPRLERRVDKL